MAPFRPLRRPDAFTLIEVLVVISIISLLISVLLPALRSARTSAHQVVSLSNTRQISVALFGYAADHRQSMPFQRQIHSRAYSHSDDYRWAVQWSQLIRKMDYISTTGVFWSPGREKRMDIGEEDVQTVFTMRPNPYTYESVGYGLNDAVTGGTESSHYLSNTPIPLKLDQGGAPPPSMMLLLAEAWETRTGVGSINGFFRVSPTNYNLDRTVRLFNYNGRIVRSYVDGRAGVGGAPSDVLISGHASETSSPRPHPDEIGWNVNFPFTAMSGARPGPYAGYWMYRRTADWERHAPWFMNWRSGWERGGVR